MTRAVHTHTGAVPPLAEYDVRLPGPARAASLPSAAIVRVSLSPGCRRRRRPSFLGAIGPTSTLTARVSRPQVSLRPPTNRCGAAGAASLGAGEASPRGGKCDVGPARVHVRGTPLSCTHTHAHARTHTHTHTDGRVVGAGSAGPGRDSLDRAHGNQWALLARAAPPRGRCPILVTAPRPQRCQSASKNSSHRRLSARRLALQRPGPSESNRRPAAARQ